MPKRATSKPAISANTPPPGVITLHRRFKFIGEFMVELFHMFALFAIGAATVWAAATAFLHMTEKSHASVEDLLLLFIYLEIGAMVGIYFKTNRMPVRFLIYVAITALTRHMISFANVTHEAETVTLNFNVLIMAAAILLLAVALLALRFGSHTYPSETPMADSRKDAKPDL